MKTSDVGIALIKFYEGFKSQPYNDATGNATIGYGCLLHSGPVDNCNLCRHYKENPLDEIEGEALLKQHTAGVCEPKLNRVSTVCPLSQQQYDCLSDFLFNEGDFTNDKVGKFKDNHLLAALKLGQYADVPAQLQRWVYGTVNGQKVILADLQRRRAAEVRLWNGQDWRDTKGTTA